MTFSTNPFFWITTSLAVALMLSLLRMFQLSRENRLLSEKNRLRSEKLTKISVSLNRIRRERNHLKEEHDQKNVFAKKLQEAELTTELQQPRLHSQATPANTTIPEKYSLIASMTRKGMSAEEIASILSLSTAEAEQLVSLSRIARDQFQYEGV